MTHSPASSEDEERHSASECPEGGSESDSSPDGPGKGLGGIRGQGSGAPGSLASVRGLQGRSMSVPDDAHFSMMVFRIGIPDLHQTKCLRFNPDATIWTAKQQVLCALSESLQDVLNYGLFQPATSGRDANFLEEERLLREYPQSFEKGVPYLEFRYKTRVYKQTNLDEKQLAKLHTKEPEGSQGAVLVSSKVKDSGHLGKIPLVPPHHLCHTLVLPSPNIPFLQTCIAHCGSHQPHIASEYLQCGRFPS